MKAFTKKILILSACLFTAGIVILGVALALKGWPGVVISSNGIQSNHSVNASSYKLEKKQIESFSSADVSINSNADISVLPSGDNHYYLEYKLDGSCEKPEYTVNDGTLTLNQKRSSVSFEFLAFSFPTDYSVRLYVPNGKSINDLKLHCVSGDLSLDGLSCSSAKIIAAYGDVTMKNSKLGSLVLNCAAGDLSLDGLSASSAKITADYGDVTMKKSKLDSLDMNVKSGDLKLTDLLAKDVTAENYYGDVTIKDFTCSSSKIGLKSGDLYLNAANPGNMEISNSYGDVTLLLPGNIAAYQFDLSAASGSLSLPRDAQKGLSSSHNGNSQYYKSKGSGKYNIQIQSNSGDITIKKRP